MAPRFFPSWIQRRRDEPDQQYEQFQTTVFDSVTDPLAIYDRDFRILRVNQALLRLFQLPGESLVGRHCYEVFYGRAGICEECHVQEVFLTGEPRGREILIPLPDGGERILEVNAYPVKDAAGNTIQAIEHGRDITAHKSLAQQCQASEEKYRTIVEMAREGIFTVDDQARFTFANEYLAKMLGYASEDLIGRSVFDFMEEEAKIIARAQFEQHRQGVANTYELNLLKNDGTRLVNLVSAAPLMVDGTFLGSLGVFTDITHLKQVEAELRVAKESGEKTQLQLEKLSEISGKGSAKSSLPELLDFLHEVIGEIFPESDPIFLILDSDKHQFLRMQERPPQVAEPMRRVLRGLEQSGLDPDFIQYLGRLKDHQIITSGGRNNLLPLLKIISDSYPSWFGLPIFAQKQCIGYFLLGSNTSREYSREELHFIYALFAQVGGYLRRLVRDEREFNQPYQLLTHKTSYGEIIGQSKEMQEVYDLIELVSGTDATVLITGDNGTGKELVAQTIHRQSKRSRGPLVVANCSAYSPTLLESELFGHEKGAFTGAIRRKKGRFELAQGGTLFLDEIGDIPPATQVLLLRFLQDHCFELVGGEVTIEADVRVLAATNKDLYREVRAARFRDDLYYRLNVITIHLPTLRQRKEDISLLCHHFLNKYNLKEGKKIAKFSSNACQALLDYDWPGNVRQLENAVSHAVILAQGEVVRRRHLPRFLKDAAEDSTPTSLSENERRLILRVLHASNWNKHEAARRLQLSRSTLYGKIRRFGLEKGMLAE
jgi:PAS domain S-box-containing protein